RVLRGFGEHANRGQAADHGAAVEPDRPRRPEGGDGTHEVLSAARDRRLVRGLVRRAQSGQDLGERKSRKQRGDREREQERALEDQRLGDLDQIERRRGELSPQPGRQIDVRPAQRPVEHLRRDHRGEQHDDQKNRPHRLPAGPRHEQIIAVDATRETDFRRQQEQVRKLKDQNHDQRLGPLRTHLTRHVAHELGRTERAAARLHAGEHDQLDDENELKQRSQGGRIRAMRKEAGHEQLLRRGRPKRIRRSPPQTKQRGRGPKRIADGEHQQEPAHRVHDCGWAEREHFRDRLAGEIPDQKREQHERSAARNDAAEERVALVLPRNALDVVLNVHADLRNRQGSLGRIFDQDAQRQRFERRRRRRLNPARRRGLLGDHAFYRLVRIFMFERDLTAQDFVQNHAQRVDVGSPVDGRSDIYALGVILYEILCGQVPFEHEDPHETVKCVISEKPTPPSWIQPSTPAALEALTLRILVKDPAERTLTIPQIRVYVQNYIEGIARQYERDSFFGSIVSSGGALVLFAFLVWYLTGQS